MAMSVPGEDLGHHPHGTVAAAHQNDVGPVVQRRARLRVPGVLGGGFEEHAAAPSRPSAHAASIRLPGLGATAP